MIISKQSNNTDYYSADEIQVKYQNLYKVLRNYIWEFEVVEAIANLEVAIYHKFPDKDEMQSALSKLHTMIYDTYSALSTEDETEFEDAYNELESAIDSYLDTGCELYSVGILSSDFDGGESSKDEHSDKNKYSFGDITKEINTEEVPTDENI